MGKGTGGVVGRTSVGVGGVTSVVGVSPVFGGVDGMPVIILLGVEGFSGDGCRERSSVDPAVRDVEPLLLPPFFFPAPAKSPPNPPPPVFSGRSASESPFSFGVVVALFTGVNASLSLPTGEGLRSGRGVASVAACLGASVPMSRGTCALGSIASEEVMESETVK